MFDSLKFEKYKKQARIGELFGNSLGIDLFVKILVFVKILSQWRRKTKFQSLEVQEASLLRLNNVAPGLPLCICRSKLHILRNGNKIVLTLVTYKEFSYFCPHLRIFELYLFIYIIPSLYKITLIDSEIPSPKLYK